MLGRSHSEQCAWSGVTAGGGPTPPRAAQFLRKLLGCLLRLARPSPAPTAEKLAPTGISGSRHTPSPGLWVLRGAQGAGLGTGSSLALSFLPENFPFGENVPCVCQVGGS